MQSLTFAAIHSTTLGGHIQPELIYAYAALLMQPLTIIAHLTPCGLYMQPDQITAYATLLSAITSLLHTWLTRPRIPKTTRQKKKAKK